MIICSALSDAVCFHIVFSKLFLFTAPFPYGLIGKQGSGNVECFGYFQIFPSLQDSIRHSCSLSLNATRSVREGKSILILVTHTWRHHLLLAKWPKYNVIPNHVDTFSAKISKAQEAFWSACTFTCNGGTSTSAFCFVFKVTLYRWVTQCKQEVLLLDVGVSFGFKYLLYMCS